MRSPPESVASAAHYAPAVAVMGVALVALWNASAALGPLDAGDLATASLTFGVPHATGYPLEVMGGRVFAWLPLANLASRVAWTSAIASAAAAGLLVAAVRRAAGSAAAWAAAGVLFAAFVTAPTLALHARIVEVYALQLALFGGALLAVERLRAGSDLRWVGVGGLLIGFGLANHALFRLLTLPLVLAALWAAPRGARVRSALLGTGAALAAQGAWFYLPAAARGRSLHNWGDPSTAARLWDHANGAYIRDAFASDMGASPALALHRAQSLAGQLVDALGPAVLPGLIGLLALRTLGPGARRLAGLLAACALVDAGYATLINPMGQRDWQNGQVLVVSVALLAALGFAAAWQVAIGRTPRLRRVGPALVVVLAAAGLLAGSAPAALVRDDRALDELVAIHAATALPGSVTTVASDGASSAVIWNQLALDARPDAVLVGRYLFGFPEQAFEVLGAAPFDALGALSEGPPPPRDQALSAFVHAILAAAGTDRAVYWEIEATRSDLPAGTPFAHRWPLGHVGQPAAGECTDALRALCAPGDSAMARHARLHAGADGLWYRRWLVTQHMWRGTRAFRAGDFAQAGLWFAHAAELDPDGVGAYTSLGAALASQGRLDEALAAIDEALARDPTSAAALRNGAQFAEAAGQPTRAAAYLARLRRLGLPISEAR